MARIVLHKELFDYDTEIRREYPILCGVDEAGRGPLAGDVYAAAVVLNEGTLIDYLNDSKKLSEKRREELFDVITEKAQAYCVATATVEEIDSLNILQATMLAMDRAVRGIGLDPDMVLVDGNRLPQLSYPARCVIKGDAHSASIAAASVLAKVSRDRSMRELAVKYPQYGFEQHKGYGTAMHYEMLEKYGISDVHRRSFLKKLIENGQD